MIPALLGLALAAAVVLPSAPPSTALERAADLLATQIEAKAAAKRQTVYVAVGSPETPELARAAQTALVAELTKRSFQAVLPLRCGVEAAEDAARAAGSDLLVRITVRVDGPEVTFAGDLVPTWVNFWAGRDPLRAAGGGPIASRARLDGQVLALAHLPEPRVPGPSPSDGEVAHRFALRQLVKLPERVVALALADLDGDKLGEVAALTANQLLVVESNGQVSARHDLSGIPRAVRGPREPAGTLAVELAEGGTARLLAFSFLRGRGEALELHGGELKVIQVLDQPAACSGIAGTLWGLPVPGKNLLAPEVRLGGRSAVLPFGTVAVVANSRPGGPAFLAVGPDGAAVALDAELKASALEGAFGSAVALGDLDGDGASELVTTLLVRVDDRVRLRRLGGQGEALYESELLAGNIAAAAAGDLDGDGRDEAVLALWGTEATPSTVVYVLGAQR
ncbi:MAG: hypothetical protein HY901_14085 [Deltaproteobacteria bacterium]|nr:hypothetical protein [Deltaproteobacteria bacterium]